MVKITLCVVVLFLLITQPLRAEIKVSSRFEGGGAKVIAIDQKSQSISIQPVVKEGRGFPCWWYFRVDGLTQGAKVKLTVGGNPKPYRGRSVLASYWILPDQAAISTDNKNWKQTPKCTRDGNAGTYQFKAPASTIWLAWGPPFLPSDAKELIQNVKRKLPNAQPFELAKTRGCRSVPAIRFGAKQTATNKPYGIWIQARQHAWESGGSWVGKGFLLWAISDAPEAIALRKKATIYYVPIMDIDSVAIGAGGKNSAPRDHNRDWDESPIYPEVRAAQERILKLDAADQFDIFIDLHNPGPKDRKPFFFGSNPEKFSEHQKRNYQKWNDSASQTIKGSESKPRLITYIKTEEELNRFSSNWVRNHTSRHVIATTLETSWNTPQGTQKGYMNVGKQLGLSLHKYLATNPRKK